MSERYQVTIDGIPDELRFAHTKANGDHQYNTKGNRSAHTFSRSIKGCTSVKASGHTIVIIKEIKKT